MIPEYEITIIRKTPLSEEETKDRDRSEARMRDYPRMERNEDRYYKHEQVLRFTATEKQFESIRKSAMGVL